MDSNKLTAAADISTIIASAVAIVALVLGGYQFYQGQKSQQEATAMQLKALAYEKESRASDLFIKYNEVMSGLLVQKADSEARYWQENLAIGLVDSLVQLERPDWQKTIQWMISNHLPFMADNPLNCDEYDPRFVALLIAKAGDKACSLSN